MNHWTDYYNRPLGNDEQVIYDHLLLLSQTESPEQIIARFRQLFMDSSAYPDPAVQAAVDRIITSGFADSEFKYILNRCCYIVLNRWMMHPRWQRMIPELVDIFDQPTANCLGLRSRQRLHDLLRQFVQTDQFLTLQRWAEVMRQDTTPDRQQPLGEYIRRYPYLYEHCLLAEENNDDQRIAVSHLQETAQRKFEVDLSQYMTHRIVRSHPNRSPELGDQIKNPTLLSDEELRDALRQFTAKVDGQHTQRDLAHQFLRTSQYSASFGSFKDDLYEYLVDTIPSSYGKRQFNQRLYDQLQDILPYHDSRRLSDPLMLRTCNKLLNFLVVESSQRPNHYLFLDLVSNLGTTAVINLLLKIVLLCRQAKCHLERRFSILFNHYESYTQENGIGWLVSALETLNVAFATNFGSMNFSMLSH